METVHIRNTATPMVSDRRVFAIGLTDFVLLFLLLIITIYPLFSGGFTTHDDANMAITEWAGHTWDAAKDASVTQGRFAFLWGLPLYSVPFIYDNRVWYLVIKYGSLCLLLAALYYSVYKSFKSNWIAFASLAFFLAVIQNGWEHNALTSYAFLFNFYATVFLVSLGLFATAIERKNLILACVSGCLYFFSLGIELFVLFFPFYLAIILSKITQGEGFIERLKYGKKYIAAIIIPLMAYLAIYALWRLRFPSTYEGNIFGTFSFLAAIEVILTYSLTAFPLASLKLYSAPGDPLPFINSVGWLATFSALNVAHIMKPIVVGLLFARLLGRHPFTVPQTRTLLIGAALAGIGIFLPNVLLGFTSRHPSWVGGGTYSYAYTYYSFISAVVFLALLLAYANVKSYTWHSFARLGFVSIIIAAMMILSFAVEVRNQYFALDQKLAHRKWQLMDVIIKSPAFMEIPDGATVAAPSLLSHGRGYAAVFAGDWNNYIKYKTGKALFINTKCNRDMPCYSLVFHQAPFADNQFAVLSKNVIPDTGNLQETTIYFMPDQPGSVVFGSFASGGVAPDIKINGVKDVNVGAGMFSYKSHRDTGSLIRVDRLLANVNIDPYKITISHFSVEPQLRPLSDLLADGIDFRQLKYPDFLAEVSGMSGHEHWGRWSDAAVDPVVRFRFKQTLPRRFTLEMIVGAFGPNIGAPVKVRVGAVEKVFVVSPTTAGQPFRLEFETDGTAEYIEIIPPQPIAPNAINPESGDRRKLGISLISLKIKSN